MRRRGSYDGTTAPIQPHLRGLAQRRRSAPNLVLGKALGMSWSPIREEAPCLVAVDQCPFVLGLTNENSELILDECAQLTEGLKTRERHLFLLSDTLVIAKLKSNASYRLKHRISLKDLWVCSFENEDEEAEDEDTDVDLRTSFVLAWSVSLCLVSFCLPELKDHWLDTLHRKTAEARSSAGSTSPPPSVLMKVLSGNTTNKTLSGVGMDSGVELPFDGNGKISTLSKQLHNQETHAQQPIENGGKRNFFPFKLKRSSTNPSFPAHPESSVKNLLFGRHLQDDTTLPKPITETLLWLFRKGPSTEGVFRVPCNSKNLNALRDQLNSGAEVNMEALPVTLLVGLLKIYLRELPGGLLVFEHYESWISALEKERTEDAQSELKRMAEKLPKANSLLLQHLLCLFHHISQRSETNKMDAKNLAVCIAPTLLHRDSQPLDRDDVEKVTKLIQFLIENCCEVFGHTILMLFGDFEEQDSIDKSDSASLMSPDISFDVHQHDSAYDSTDPDVDCDCMEAESQTQEDNMMPRGSPGLSKMGRSDIQSCSSDAIFDAFTNPFNRRCSEPSIFPSAPITGLRELARSHDDFSTEKEDFDNQPLKKQNSDDSFLHPHHCENRRSQMSLKKVVGSLNTPISVSSPTSKAGSCPSFCSSDSTSSNLSEQSTTTSPLPSPASPRKSQSTRHSSFMSKSKNNHAPGDLEVSRRSFSMRAKSLGNFTFNRGSLKKGDSQKEVAFPCETLQEDSQNETENIDELVRRRRPLSAIEVFQHVDSRMPCSPPSYEQALQTGGQPAPPQYRAMTVQHARELGRKSRPISMNDNLLDVYKVNEPTEHIETFTESVQLVEPQPVSFRQRAMSESVSQTRHDRVSRRCSQPVFEEFSYAKESYV
ncbi:T cell activation RhoGTPase activating protein b isoform X4 [Ctenopharyngodon idella]|uniref:T cell activation RhoGTPase activating protein b isoform X4 n=1 Tax=Ctenopharyngodon idella TaxID=7959 RepID=UPI002231FA88|nr:T cell activation RhoGTPase activating protein b isoform X4 [Ctenopharyngodon idella]